MATGNERTNRVRAVADELAGIEDEKTGPDIHVHVDNTGRFPAVDPVTKPDNQRPESDPPKSGLVRSVGGAVAGILKLVNNPWAFLALAVIVAGAVVAFGMWLRFR